MITANFTKEERDFIMDILAKFTINILDPTAIDVCLVANSIKEKLKGEGE